MYSPVFSTRDEYVICTGGEKLHGLLLLLIIIFFVFCQMSLKYSGLFVCILMIMGYYYLI